MLCATPLGLCVDTNPLFYRYGTPTGFAGSFRFNSHRLIRRLGLVLRTILACVFKSSDTHNL